MKPQLCAGAHALVMLPAAATSSAAFFALCQRSRA